MRHEIPPDPICWANQNCGDSVTERNRKSGSGVFIVSGEKLCSKCITSVDPCPWSSIGRLSERYACTLYIKVKRYTAMP